jgi:2,3-bisphosphoglycerate-independent phosphoglycerate mutase
MARRKYIILVGDGMGDYPQEELEWRTPLEAARTPQMDRIASQGIMGWIQTVPPDSEPGSDIANLSILGYDPRLYHTGRGPFEALSMGLELQEDDAAFRCNLVHLKKAGNGAVFMDSYSAGHISSEEAGVLIEELNRHLKSDRVSFHPGVSYRHILLWKGADVSVRTVPPHDLTGQEVTEYLQDKGPLGPVLELMRRSWPILDQHVLNQERERQGKATANSIWLWGQGLRPSMPSFQERYGLQGGMISAVDLLKGIGLAAGLEPLGVEGMTGYLDTNYEGKAEKALDALQDRDLVYLHVEAPDEASHEGSLAKKIQAIEDFDRKVVGRVREGLEQFTDFSLLVLTDHFTPLSLMTHTREPVPLGVLTSENTGRQPRSRGFSEKSALEGEVAFPKGEALMPWFIKTGLKPKI